MRRTSSATGPSWPSRPPPRIGTACSATSKSASSRQLPAAGFQLPRCGPDPQIRHSNAAALCCRPDFGSANCRYGTNGLRMRTPRRVGPSFRSSVAGRRTEGVDEDVGLDELARRVSACGGCRTAQVGAPWVPSDVAAFMGRHGVSLSAARRLACLGSPRGRLRVTFLDSATNKLYSETSCAAIRAHRADRSVRFRRPWWDCVRPPNGQFDRPPVQ